MGGCSKIAESAVAELRRTMQKSSVSLAGNRGNADGPCPQVARTTSFDRGSTVATTHCRQQSRVAMAGNTRCPLILDDAALDDADSRCGEHRVRRRLQHPRRISNDH